MKFQYFTFLLNPLEQGGLFPDKRHKIEILREILSGEALNYKVHGSNLAFVHDKTEGEFILGKVGKRSTMVRHLPPEEKFAEQAEESWPYCVIFFNLSTDPATGQRIAFEYKSSVFPSPIQQVKNLAAEINSKLFSSGYAISINPITIEQDFWKIIEQHEEKIEKLSFTLNAPNLFNLGNSLESDLKESQKEYAMTKATIEFENPNGKLKVPHNKLTDEAVEYIARGGGEYRVQIRGKARQVISSSKKILTKTFEDLEIVTNSQKALFNIIDTIFK